VYLTRGQTHSLQRLIALLAEDYGEAEIRKRVGVELLSLLDADYFASFVWDPTSRRFDGRVAINMGDENLGTYERYFQFHDPITYELQKRRGPTLVSQVMPQADLIRTEFYNDFLARDGLYHGVNLFAYLGDRNIGDLRVWRGRHREPFDRDTLTLLSLIEPVFTRALTRGGAPIPAEKTEQKKEVALIGLSAREQAIARLICNGRSDKEIARELNVAFSTVRTHVARIFEKLNVHNRTQLAKRLFRPH